MISDLRYVDPVSLSGEMQTRSILQNIGTPGQSSIGCLTS